MESPKKRYQDIINRLVDDSHLQEAERLMKKNKEEREQKQLMYKTQLDLLHKSLVLT